MVDLLMAYIHGVAREISNWRWGQDMLCYCGDPIAGKEYLMSLSRSSIFALVRRTELARKVASIT